MIADGTPIGRGKLLVVHEDASGRIVALDSSSYLDHHLCSMVLERWHPDVAALVVDRLRRRGKCGIGERTHSNGNRLGSPLRFPKYRRAAIRAEVKVHGETAVGIPSIGSEKTQRCRKYCLSASGSLSSGTAKLLQARQCM